MGKDYHRQRQAKRSTPVLYARRLLFKYGSTHHYFPMKHLSILSATTLLIATLIGCQEEETSRVLPNYPVARVAPPDPDPWQLVWSDEFQYAGKPDPSKWRYEWGYVRNQELQYYTNRPENVRVVDNEYLVIEARRDSAVVDGEVREITSASLNTRYKHSWQYGKLEIRAQIPSSLGTWPALWMLPDSYQKVPWPLCGEIDIMEHVGYDPDYVHTTIHTEAYNHRKKTQKGLKTFLPDIVEQFHTYGIEWNAQKIDFFVDRNLVFTVNKESGDTEEEWPFDQPFYLIMNLAFGGAWGGSQGVDKSSLPQKCLIDYVRVYQARDTLTTRDSTVTVRARGTLGERKIVLRSRRSSSGNLGFIN